MPLLFWILVGICANTVVGAVVCAVLDSDDMVFFKWYKDDPTGVISTLVIELWPIMAFFMILYRYKHREEVKK